jgi:hypothetical protein
LRYWSIPCIVLTLHLQTHLFGPLKQALRDHRFTMDQQLDVTVHEWLVAQPKTFYSEVIKQIVQWWTKCIVKLGDYVEKLCSCKISALVFVNMKHTVRIIIDSPLYVILGRQHLNLLLIIFYVTLYICYINVYWVFIMTDDHHDKSFLMVCFISIATEAFRIAEMQCVYVCMCVCVCKAAYIVAQ